MRLIASAVVCAVLFMAIARAGTSADCSAPAAMSDGWPGALYVYEELEHLVAPGDLDDLGFSEIWLMDDGPKYTSRRDPRSPADFFCFSPAEQIGFWGQERKRRPYWSLMQDRFL
jgi:hypothetical protein